MNITLAGYKINTKLHENSNSLIYSGQRIEDKCPVVVKILRAEYPLPEQIARFKREFMMTESLSGDGIIKVYSLEKYENSLAMIMEDFGGQSLAKFIATNKLETTAFLHLALQVVDGLSAIHQQHIIHKDINPANVIWNPQTNQVKIIDFGISTALSREKQEIRNPNVLEGTLAYMSPEQTGRMNRALDYRTDFYSLGATFYQLLTGRLPFETNDTLELAHSHLAKNPTPPHQLNPNIPQTVSDIVLKLMAKNAEERYQSTHGLKMDLEEATRQWQDSKQIIPFPLAQKDISDKFHIPQKLYGREEETKKLLAAFERVAENKAGFNIEMMLVTGYAGVGKSSLVQEIHKPITGRRGYFIDGKFDQFQRNIPYSAIIRAFQSLVRQILAENEAEIAAWRQKLLTALEPNGQVIIDVIPEISLIIGSQPDVPALAPGEAQNRFNFTFQNFIKLFTKPEHPLVIFLDDLQWADVASLKLLQLLMTDPDSEYLFLIGAYRHNEVDEAHPLSLTLKEIKKAQGQINSISLLPLNLTNIIQLVADTMHCETSQAEALAELIQAKTDGNPFFINEFLKMLYSDSLIDFHYETGEWCWNLEQIQNQAVMDNVVDLMTDKIHQLDEKTERVLQLAACIGNRFDLESLAVIYEQSPQKSAGLLLVAVAEGLILPLSDDCKLMSLEVEGLTCGGGIEYKFAHDRIQQAAYALISKEDKEAVHLRVGQLLLSNSSADEREQKLFDIVNHLNLGRRLIDNQVERDNLTELNLTAGKKAKESTAYQAAFDYLQTGIELLSCDGENCWQRKYDLTLTLYTETAEAAYLKGDFDSMDKLAKVVLSKAKNLLDKTKLYEIKMRAYQAKNRQLEVVETGLSVLKLLGIGFPKKPNTAHTILWLLKTKLALYKLSFFSKQNDIFEELLNRPAINDPHKLITMRILTIMSSSAYFTRPDLFPLILFKTVNMSVKYGNSPESANGYIGYSIILSGVLGDIDAGYKFGQLALYLNEKLDVKEHQARILAIFNIFIEHSKKHGRDTLTPLLEAYKIGLSVGDLEFAAVGVYSYSYHSFLLGRELTNLEKELAIYGKVIAQLKQKSYLNYQKLYWQVLLNLIGKAKDPSRLVGEQYDEEKMLELYREAKDSTGIAATHIQKLYLAYLFHKYEQAMDSMNIIENNLESLMGTMDVPVFYLYNSLTRLALYPEAQSSEKKTILKKVAANQKKIKKWAKHAPMNHLHKFYLVEAEHARVTGQAEKAKNCYEQAIKLAHENEYLNEEALANELAAAFYMAEEQPKFAQIYLRDAHYAYLRWGAKAKVEDLEQRYPQFFNRAEEPALSTIMASTTARITSSPTSTNSSQTKSQALDMTSVVKSLQAISGEIEKDRLLATLMKIVIESGGAQKGYLILEKDGQLLIEANGDVEQEENSPMQTVVAVGDSDNLPTTIINYVANTHKHIVLDDATNESRFSQDGYIIANQPKSVLCTPLVNQGKLTGILYLENNLTTGAFTENRIQLLTLLSAQAAISIENAQLYADMQSSEEKYRTIFEDSKDTIFISTPDGQIIDFNPVGLSLFGYSIKEILKLNARDLYTDSVSRKKLKQEIEQQGAIKDFGVKLRTKDGTEIDCLITATVRRAVDGTILSYQGIIRDITAQKQAEQERLRLTSIEKELTLANNIQTSLLPPAKPDWTDLDVICYSTPAREIGGDFYAYHPFKNGAYAIVVGDVTGKGMPAALLMAVSLASFRSTVAGHKLTPAELLAQLDSTLMDYTHTTKQNCAFVYTEIEPDGTMYAANAGCITPIIKRVDGSVEWVEVGGMPLGVGLGAKFGYQDTSVQLAKGDLVILSSDGVVEANNPTDEMFGFERFEQAVFSGPQTGAEAMLEHLQAEIALFVENAEPHDDLTIVVVQFS